MMIGARTRIPVLALLLAAGFSGLGSPPATANAAAPSATEIPPTAAAQIIKVTPDQAVAGSPVTVEIQGSNFSAGAYVSFSTPAVRAVSTTRVSATNIQATLEVNPSAQAGTLTLYVSNPAGVAAQASFTVLPASIQPAPATTLPAAEKNAPVVNFVEPAKLAPGSRTTLKIKGKGFADGAMVGFSNPRIQVLATRFSKSKELEVDVQIAADAATGTVSLFVMNPDNSEAEHAFEIAAGNPTTTLPTAAATTTPMPVPAPAKGEAAANEQKFEVYNLGDAKSIFQNPGKAKGTLILAGKTLRYEEDGKVVFSAGAAEIEEIAPNVVFGINTATFHVILKSSKTYNFVGASLRPADTQAIVDSLRRALQ
jgi:hypothetical protein